MKHRGGSSGAAPTESIVYALRSSTGMTNVQTTDPNITVTQAQGKDTLNLTLTSEKNLVSVGTAGSNGTTWTDTNKPGGHPYNPTAATLLTVKSGPTMLLPSSWTRQVGTGQAVIPAAGVSVKNITVSKITPANLNGSAGVSLSAAGVAVTGTSACGNSGFGGGTGPVNVKIVFKFA